MKTSHGRFFSAAIVIAAIWVLSTISAKKIIPNVVSSTRQSIFNPHQPIFDRANHVRHNCSSVNRFALVQRKLATCVTPRGSHVVKPAREFVGTDRFKLLRRLGTGGMGVVYEAHDRKMDKVVALKTLTLSEAAHIYRFKREFRTLVDVSHPNLVTLYELMSEGQSWFFTMELVKGVTFIQYVRPDTIDVSALDVDHTLQRE